MDATEQKLLEAACQVFAEKGRAATVRQILARAGIKNAAAVNYYFGDKDKLYEAALRHAFQCRLDDLDVPHWPEGTPLGVKLRALIHAVVERMIVEDVPWYRQLLLRELADPGKAGRGIVRDFVRPVYQMFWSALAELRIDEQKMHLIAFSMVGQCFYHKVAAQAIRLVVGDAEADSYTAPRIADHVTDFSLRALGIAESQEPRAESRKTEELAS